MKTKPHDVLVLNKGWAPIHIVTWKRAVSLIFQDKAFSIDHVSFAPYSFTQWKDITVDRPQDFYYLTSTSYVVALPEIVVAADFNRLPDRQVKYSRQSVFSRDNHCCGYCGKVFPAKDLTIDHIIPRSKGGDTKWSNVISCCRKCNQKKSNHLLSECGMKLLFTPTKPGWVSPIACTSSRHVCKSWGIYMDNIAVSE